MGVVEDELVGPSVFKDRGKLNFDYVPEALPHREPELRQLALWFKTVVQGASGQNVFITGPVGSGKTALAKRFCAEISEAARKQGRTIEWAYVNCRSKRTDAMALLQVLHRFDAGFPERGFSVPEMLRSLRQHLKKRDAHLIAILDEVDVLLKHSGSDLIYNFTRFDAEEAPGSSPMLSLLAISVQDVFALMDDASRSTFKRTNLLRLGSYTRAQLLDIVAQRAELAFHKGTVPRDVQEFIADLAAEHGDARLAIELLENAGQLADDGHEELVSPEHVRVAQGKLHHAVPDAKLREVPRQELFVLLALARRLARDGTAYAITGDVERTYHVVCEEHAETPRAHTQFYKYLKDLERLGFVTLRPSPGGIPGNTQLISLPEVAAAELRERLEPMLAAPPAAR